MNEDRRSFEANDSGAFDLNDLILLPENRIQLSEEGHKRFAELIIDPPPLNDAMKKAKAEQDRLIVSSES